MVAEAGAFAELALCSMCFEAATPAAIMRAHETEG